MEKTEGEKLLEKMQDMARAALEKGKRTEVGMLPPSFVSRDITYIKLRSVKGNTPAMDEELARKHVVLVPANDTDGTLWYGAYIRKELVSS